ncbi:hypothetical protein F5Y09DRAFT_345042 [Xylaria sp. FL1042]|nr:hypothetical protein F5Y09DRAFT_345042 [Xylaria sp. FL1042]
MADPFRIGMDRAAAISRALEQCKTIEDALRTTRASKKYQQTIQSLGELFQQLQSCPELQTPEIMDCTDSITETITSISAILPQHWRKICNYRHLFKTLESQRNSLAQYVMKPSHPSNPPLSSIVSYLPGSIHNFDTFLTVDIENKANNRLPGPALNTNFQSNNIHTEDATQVVGQLVRRGHAPQPFTGHFCNNSKKGTGEQVIGIVFE